MCRRRFAKSGVEQRGTVIDSHQLQLQLQLRRRRLLPLYHRYLQRTPKTRSTRWLISWSAITRIMQCHTQTQQQRQQQWALTSAQRWKRRVTNGNRSFNYQKRCAAPIKRDLCERRWWICAGSFQQQRQWWRLNSWWQQQSRGYRRCAKNEEIRTKFERFSRHFYHFDLLITLQWGAEVIYICFVSFHYW